MGAGSHLSGFARANEWKWPGGTMLNSHHDLGAFGGSDDGGCAAAVPRVASAERVLTAAMLNVDSRHHFDIGADPCSHTVQAKWVSCDRPPSVPICLATCRAVPPHSASSD
ncbi:hypothetical protein QAD02_017295 [Eretmocerus hayati]|uniref:Uncharacterized protein n=1 Tax=Eretmocerus hayati TaxID=131215 RepID=A0ACC2PDG4_9HYME|nr:hypothetical protein QAD02_017295 [Eretmocerus hayati]